MACFWGVAGRGRDSAVEGIFYAGKSIVEFYTEDIRLDEGTASKAVSVTTRQGSSPWSSAFGANKESGMDADIAAASIEDFSHHWPKARLSPVWLEMDFAIKSGMSFQYVE